MESKNEYKRFKKLSKNLRKTSLHRRKHAALSKHSASFHTKFILDRQYVFMRAPFIHPLQFCDVTKDSFWTGVKTKRYKHENLRKRLRKEKRVVR